MTENFELSDQGREFIKKELVRYETKHSAIIPALYQVQKEKGWVPPYAINYLAKLMELPESHINEVFHFYTMFNKVPVGKLHIQVCTNISCSMNGGRELAQKLCEHFKVKPGEVSQDGRVSVSQVECLGSCDTAPMMQVNDTYVEKLDLEKAIQALKDMGA